MDIQEDNRLRVLLLAREQSAPWVQLYAEAFRRQCDTLVVGPPLADDSRAVRSVLDEVEYFDGNNILTETDDVLEVIRHLPAGWHPQLVVSVQSATPLWRNLPLLACPTAHISVDTWHDHREFEFARGFDFVFAAQRVFPPYFRQSGSRHAVWLPLACDPNHHKPFQEEEELDIVFVGSLNYLPNRQRLKRLERLNDYFNVGILSGITAKSMSSIFCRGRIVFNSSISQDVNMRVFEALAAGRLLLTNRDAEANGLFDLFTDGIHLVAYDDETLIQQARELLDQPEKRRTIAQAGYTEALARHTYDHRVNTVIETVARLASKSMTSSAAPVRQGFRLSAYLPYGATYVIDAGLGMDRSRLALRAAGIARFLGITQDREELRRRERSYDAVLCWSERENAPSGADAVFWTDPGQYPGGLDACLAQAHAWLEDGGSLILSFPCPDGKNTSIEDDSGAWETYLAGHGFYRTAWMQESDGATRMVLARRFSRPFQAMSEEIYARFPGGDDAIRFTYKPETGG